jgi:hypothetical protein
MFTERFQILLSPEQRAALEREAHRRGISVAALIREAVTQHLGGVDRKARLEAVARIRAMRGRYLPPEELDRVIEEERLREAWPSSSTRT